MQFRSLFRFFMRQILTISASITDGFHYLGDQQDVGHEGVATTFIALLAFVPLPEMEISYIIHSLNSHRSNIHRSFYIISYLTKNEVAIKKQPRN